MSGRLEEARARLEAAEQTVSRWEGKADELTTSLAKAQATVGTAVLERGDLEGASRQIDQMREEVKTARSTIEAAQAARDAAKREVILAEAADLRAEAQQLDEEANKHSERTRELLSALEAHEGGPYSPERRPLGTSVVSSQGYWPTKTEQLRGRAKEARKKATHLERQAQRFQSQAGARGEATRAA